jgi:hypothetical protein
VTAVFLVPRRNDNGHRDQLWQYARARWEQYFHDVAVVEGHHDDGPFNRAAAINRAARAAGEWDVGIIIDSDVLLSVSQVRAAIDSATSTGKVTWGHRRWRGIREDATVRLVADQRDLGAELNRDELDLIVERTNPLSWSCCIAVPRPVFDDLGGLDERFKGWGFEDMAFQSVICGLYGYERIEGDVVHLWHPRSEERILKGETRATATPEYVTNARLGRRYMVALRRDHALHDRGDQPALEEERQRDIDNLRRDDAKYDDVARRHGLPDWTSWWPTLEELRDGAKAVEAEAAASSVTVVVTTGGDEANWAERSDYLRRSLESLNDRVTGPIVQRVVYSDWAGHAEELAAIAEEEGFYVVGGGHHGYTGARRRLWAYLAKRARGTFIFAAEDDFTYDRDVDLAPMIETLEARPELRQLALLRGPYYPRELEAGGVLQSLATPHELVNHRAHPFVTHRDHFTANPSLFRRSLTSVEWPNAASSERVFGDVVLRDPSARFAYWGAGEPWVSHVGAVRAGTSY